MDERRKGLSLSLSLSWMRGGKEERRRGALALAAALGNMITTIDSFLLLLL
jgi:hypothetical protein